MRCGNAMETSPPQAAPEPGNFYKASRIPIIFFFIIFFPIKIQYQHFLCLCLKLFVSVPQLGFCPVQSCLLQAKHPGLHSPQLWHLQFHVMKGTSKVMGLVFVSSHNEIKQMVKSYILGGRNNCLLSSWSSMRFVVYFHSIWVYSIVQEGCFTLWTVFSI